MTRLLSLSKPFQEEVGDITRSYSDDRRRHGADYPSCIYDRIHPYTEEEEQETTFDKYRTSHMETDHEELKVPKMTKH
jgi:hypothetical protein